MTYYRIGMIPDGSGSGFFQRHSKKIKFITSFNYDLLVKDVLNAAGVKCGYVIEGARIEAFGNVIPIFKPHGSINYRFTDIRIAGSRWAMRANDGTVVVIAGDLTAVDGEYQV